MCTAENGHLPVAESLLTTISNAERERMRNSYAVNFAIKRMVGGTKDIRQCVTRELAPAFIEDRMQQAIHLLSMACARGLTARDVALMYNHRDFADYIDLNNQESCKKIRKLIETNVRHALSNK